MKEAFTLLTLLTLLLTGCAAVAPTSTATPVPTETPVPILATSASDIIGIWQLGSGNFALFFQFDEDGAYRTAQRVAINLQDNPTQLGEYTLEGGLLTLATSDDSPLCAGQSGAYEVHLLEGGQISFSLQEDPCTLRAETSYSGLEPVSP